MFLMHFLHYVSIETEYLITHISALQKTFLILELGEPSSCMGGHNILLNTIKHKCQTRFATLQGKRNVSYKILNVSRKYSGRAINRAEN
jgi:hypothetical protein